MKKYVYMIVTLMIVLALSACSMAAGQGTNSSDTTQQASGGNSTSGQGSQNQPGQREMPLAMKLALGTFKLENTKNAVDADQAKTLLTLWKTALALSQSETTAAEEIEAVVNQIQDSMTAEQMAAIDGMDLSFGDMRTIAEEMGLDFGGASGFGNMSPEMQATMQAARESGQAPGGGFGGGPGEAPSMGGGFGGGFGGDFNREMRQTAEAGNGNVTRVSLGLPPPLLEALINFLEGKVQ